MKVIYRLYRRGATFYCEHAETGKQESLRTSNRAEALQLVAAKNESERVPYLSRSLAHAYLEGSEPKISERTWGDVMSEMLISKIDEPGEPLADSSVERCKRAFEQPGLRELRSKKLVETTKGELIQILRTSATSTKHYLARLHNLAVHLTWLPWFIIHPKQWPRIKRGARPAITEEQHRRIIQAEHNEERRRYYEVLWETGASQSDAANFNARNIDWSMGVLSYRRMKTGSGAELTMGPKLMQIIKSLPSDGPLFPRISKLSASDRAAEFARQCKKLEITGISLHSYRYSWAQRAKALSLPERVAQKALGHNSVGVHRAYAKGGKDNFASLDFYEAASTKSAGSA